MKNKKILKVSHIDTELGPMIAVADEHVLYLLEFINQSGLIKKTLRLKQETTSQILTGQTAPIRSITKELEQYFLGKSSTFHTPLHPLGTPFQQQVWQALRKIPSGETRSYRELARAIGKPTAYRAVAQANSRNPLALIIPCHRVINTNGGLGGYAGGVARKKWLIDHEKR